MQDSYLRSTRRPFLALMIGYGNGEVLSGRDLTAGRLDVVPHKSNTCAREIVDAGRILVVEEEIGAGGTLG